MTIVDFKGATTLREVSLEEIVRKEIGDSKVRQYMPYRDEAAVQRHIKYLSKLDKLTNLIFQEYSNFGRFGMCCKLHRNINIAIDEIYDTCSASPDKIFIVHGIIIPGYAIENGIDLELVVQERIDRHHEFKSLQRKAIIDSVLLDVC